MESEHLFIVFLVVFIVICCSCNKNIEYFQKPEGLSQACQWRRE